MWEGDLSEGSVFKVYLKHHIWTSSMMYIWRHDSVMCTSVKRSKKWAMQGPWSCRQELAFAYCGGQQTSTRNTCQPNQSTFHNVETCSWTYSIHLYCSRVQAQSIYWLLKQLPSTWKSLVLNVSAYVFWGVVLEYEILVISICLDNHRFWTYFQHNPQQQVLPRVYTHKIHGCDHANIVSS